MHDVHPCRPPRAAGEVLVEPGHRVVHVPAGPYDLPKEALADQVDEFTDGVLEHIEATGGRRRRSTATTG